MTEPIVLISKHRIKEGKMEELKQYNKQVMPKIEAAKPGTVFHYAYVNNDDSIISFVHVFPDAEAMTDHMIGVDERAGRAYDYIEPMSMEIWGTPNEAVIEMFKQIEANGISVNYLPQNLGGYIRLAAA